MMEPQLVHSVIAQYYVFRHGEWGAICDDGWNVHSANVVCKQLGHPHALGQTSQAYFGQPKQGTVYTFTFIT